MTARSEGAADRCDPDFTGLVDTRHVLLRELAWASRVNPHSPSRKALRKLFERPDVLDYIERLVKADAER